MTDTRLEELRHHKLPHIPLLKVDPVVFEARFEHGCSMQNCNAACCQEGVMVDLKERETILRHADLVRGRMEPEQVHESEGWFDQEGIVDVDFPSARAVGTRTTERGCVFLMKDGRCVLQTVAEEEGMPRHALKPFFCYAFPVTIESGVLTVDDPEFTNRPECCSMIPKGHRSVLEVCREELEFVLGAEGMTELASLVAKRQSG